MAPNMILRSAARRCARVQLFQSCQRSFNTQMPLLKDKTVSKVANRTVPAEAPGADTFGQTNMLSSFNNMFDRGPNVGVEIITKKGFVLSNNVQIEQPLVLLNGSAFLWRAPENLFTNPDLEAFKIFEVASPKPELVLFGTGREFQPVPQELRHYFYKLGIQVDQMNTKHAAATYNVLAEEGRRVAGVLLPIGEKKPQQQ
ncbi:hypothetical protein BCR43DRAFT_497753 [Syncephalastrum racemosum]|uniref:NADH dehydrogenase [ubiquinone] 1 alpha subcomplex assembly factor 3 n=1 Tax=Syncephalastrum racemosum TaxID=13706 RepID=A0A1X2H3X5_SYNRA|nr:hypothetical protein BCR43DRAFT_497753 [Syncephalastrum racemosum]